MSRAKLTFSIIFLLFSIIFTFNHHLGFSVGDTILSKVGLLPYTTTYVRGVHITLFIGLGMLVCSYFITRKLLGSSFPRLASKLWLMVLVIVLSYSFITDKVMYVVKWNATGTNAVSYVQNQSSCMYDVVDDGDTLASCYLIIKNYSGQLVVAMVKPDLARSYRNQDDPLYESLSSVELKPVRIEIEPRSTFAGQLAFSGLAGSPLPFQGKLHDIVLDIGIEGQNIVFDYEMP
ncbi:hypothetical protein [Paenibacillus tundrae]|uniref:hypothetical protein n=1 Tax=Paenibacillus tundrae TaxID=528187 RepID=UPI0030D5FD32